MLPLIVVIVEVFGSLAIIGYTCIEPAMSTRLQIILPFLLGIFGTDLYQRAMNGWPYLRTIWKLVILTVTGKPLRISFATLIRIKVNDKYLLVKSRRTSKFQPPGGVLRFFDPNIKDKYQLSADSSFKALKDDEFRLRFQPGGLWKFFGFLNWYDSQLSRELTPHREFYEELIDTNILDPNIFSKPQFSYIKRVVPPITYGTHFQIHEFFIFEIFEMILDQAQKDYINKLGNRNDFVMMGEDQIARNGFDSNTSATTPIGSQTKHILHS